MPDDPTHIELVPEGMKVKSGEVMYGDGRVAPVIWIEANGRRLHTSDDEQLLVFLFLSPEDAEAHGISIIKEVAMLGLSITLPPAPLPPHD